MASTPDPPAARRTRTVNQAARLSGAGAFEAVFRHGSRREGRFVQIVTAPAALSTGRAGFVVSRKALRRAVDRNRLKRIVREYLRESRAALGAFDVVIRLKRPIGPQQVPAAAAEAIALVGLAVARLRDDSPPQTP